MKNNTQLTRLEIEQMRCAIRQYTDYTTRFANHIEIKEIVADHEGCDFVATCRVYFLDALTDFDEKEYVLGINRARVGFKVPMD